MSVSSIQLKTPASDQAPLLQSEKMVIPPELVTHILKQIPLIEIPHLAKLSQTWCFFVKSSKTKSALVKHLATSNDPHLILSAQIFKDKYQTESLYRSMIQKELDSIHENKMLIKRIQKFDFGRYEVRDIVWFDITPYRFGFGPDSNRRRSVRLDSFQNGVVGRPDQKLRHTFTPKSDKESLYVPQYSLASLINTHKPQKPLTQLIEKHTIRLENGTIFEFKPTFMEGSPAPVVTQVLFNGKLIKKIKSKIIGLPIYEENRMAFLLKTNKEGRFKIKVWDFNLRPLTISKKLKVKIIYGY